MEEFINSLKVLLAASACGLSTPVHFASGPEKMHKVSFPPPGLIDFYWKGKL